MHERLTVAALPLAIMQVACGLGLDETRLRLAAGLASDLDAERDRPVPVRNLVALWHEILALRPDGGIGIQIAAQCGLQHFGLVGCVIRHSPTLLTALEKIGRFKRLLDADYRIDTRETPEGTVVGFHFQSELHGLPDAMESCLGTVYLWLQQLAGTPLNTRLVRLRHPASASAGVYERQFGCPVQFQGDDYAIVLPTGTLDRPTVSVDSEAARYLESLASQRMDLHFPDVANDVASIRFAIERAVLEGDCSQTRLSSDLCVSARTLMRRLEEAGMTYTQLVAEVKAQVAKRLLHDGKHSVVDVAFTLGYSEVSSFHRAFKQWTGQTPVQYRQAMPAGVG